MPATTTHPPETDDSSSLLSRRPYMLFLAGRFLGTLSTGSQSVVIAWDVYASARRTMSTAEAAPVVEPEAATFIEPVRAELLKRRISQGA